MVTSLIQTAIASYVLVLEGQTRCSRDYFSPQGRCTEQIDDLPIVTGLLIIQARLHRPPCFFFICRASRRPITSVEFKFVTRQVVASVVIRAAKLESVLQKVELESTLRNMFP